MTESDGVASAPSMLTSRSGVRPAYPVNSSQATARNAARSNFAFVFGNLASRRRIAAASTPAPQLTAK